MAKKNKKQKQKIMTEMRLENEMINHQINKQEQQIKIKKTETKEVLDELNQEYQIKKKNNLKQSQEEIETKQQKLDNSILKLKANNIVLDKFNEKLDLINNMSFSKKFLTLYP